MIQLLTAIGLSPGGSSTVHIYTQTIHRTIQNKQYIEQHNNFRRVRAVPRLGQLYPGICLTTEEKAGKNLGQGSRVTENSETKSGNKKQNDSMSQVLTSLCQVDKIYCRITKDKPVYRKSIRWVVMYDSGVRTRAEAMNTQL